MEHLAEIATALSVASVLAAIATAFRYENRISTLESEARTNKEAMEKMHVSYDAMSDKIDKVLTTVTRLETIMSMAKNEKTRPGV